MEQKPNFSRFRISENLQFFEDVGGICTKADVVVLGLETQVNDLAQTTLNLGNNFNQGLASEYTFSLSELDASRDVDIKLLRKVSDAYCYHFDEDKAQAASLVLSSIDSYGKGIYKMNYQAETTVLTSLAKDLKQTDEAAAIALLGLTDVLDHMIEMNGQFNEQYLNRLEEKAADDDVKTAELVKEAILKWQELETFIEANEVLNPSDELSSLVDNLDELIGAYNSTVASRSSKTEETV